MRIQDVADILIMSFLVYQLYVWFRKTRALQIVFGLGFLVILYFVTKSFGLYMTSWILQELGTVVFILVIVVFQNEIRQALYRFSLLQNLFNSSEKKTGFDATAVANTIFMLAEKRTGALLVFERQERLEDHLLHGVPVDGLVSGPLIASIFDKSSPLHDGAVVIRGARISEASSHLPLSASGDLPQHFGTRHRAALGLSERTDALVVVVSEERGTVSVVVGGELSEISVPEALASLLAEAFATLAVEKIKPVLKQRLVNNVAPKFMTVIMVIICWLLIGDRQGGLQTVQAQVKFHNVPGNLALKNDLPRELEAQLKVISAFLPSVKKLEITADLDLSKLHEGVNMVPVDSRSFQLPLGVTLVKASPAVLKIVAEKIVYRDLPVVCRKEGRLPGRLKLKSTKIEPARVRVVGPESMIAGMNQVQTEVIDLGTVSRSQSIDVKLLPPAPQVQLSEATVKAKLVVAK